MKALYFTLHLSTLTPHTHTHTKASSNLRRCSQVGSCVLQRLMKASHLKNRSDGARSDCFQRDPDDLCQLKHRCFQPLHALPLISLCSPQALGYPATEVEGASCFLPVVLFPEFLLRPVSSDHSVCSLELPSQKPRFKVAGENAVEAVTVQKDGIREERWWMMKR